MTSRTLLVTGGTGALGGAVTKRLLADGHRVAVTWVVDDERARLEAEISDRDDRLALVRADVTDERSVSNGIKELRARFGAPDALVHLVGAWGGGKLVEELDLETWDKMHRINLTSAFIMAKAVLPGMRQNDWGRIVFVSSRTAKIGRHGQSAYAVAKSGVAVLAEAIAEETKGTGITANVVAPSTMDTPANRAAMPDADHTRWVSPEEVAATISYLCSDPAGALRGAWMPVYGSV